MRSALDCGAGKSRSIHERESRVTIRRALKERLAAHDMVVGTFIKTPSPIVVEVLSMTGLDFLCLDAEHAPFDRAELDSCIMAARSDQMDILVRIASIAPENIQTALDSGATGVVAPHVRSAADARALVEMSAYGDGGRSYSASSRAGRYGRRSMSEHLGASADRTVVIAQIEDPEAVASIDEIAAVRGLDALFIGCADLTVAVGADSPDAPSVIRAAEQVCAASMRHGLAVGLFLNRSDDALVWRDKGASLFLLQSDQNFLAAGAARLVDTIRNPDPTV